jgi:hypothetical protein
VNRAEYAARAEDLMEQLSSLVREVEVSDRDGAALLVEAVSSSCWQWQAGHLNRTELLDEALKRLRAVIESAPGTERGSLMVAALGNVKNAAAALLGDKP